MAAEIEVTLQDGYTVGNDTFHVAVLREPTTGDVIEAQEASEKMVLTPDGPQLVTSPSRMGHHMLARQIRRVGDGENAFEGPLSIEDLKKFSTRDFSRLMAEADRIEGAADAEIIREQSVDRGRDEGVDSAD